MKHSKYKPDKNVSFWSFVYLFLKFLLVQVEVSRFLLSNVAMEDPVLRFNTLCRLTWRDGSWTILFPFSIILCCRYWTVLPVLKYCFSYDTTINSFIFSMKDVKLTTQPCCSTNSYWSLWLQSTLTPRAAWIFFPNRWYPYNSKGSCNGDHGWCEFSTKGWEVSGNWFQN